MAVRTLKLVTKIFRLNVVFDETTKPGMMLELVTVAYNETHARRLAGLHSGLEGPQIWDNRNKTCCVEIGAPRYDHRYPGVLCRFVQTPYKEQVDA